MLPARGGPAPTVEREGEREGEREREREKERERERESGRDRYREGFQLPCGVLVMNAFPAIPRRARPSCMGFVFRAKGLGVRIEGLGCRVQVVRFRMCGEGDRR